MAQPTHRAHDGIPQACLDQGRKGGGRHGPRAPGDGGQADQGLLPLGPVGLALSRLEEGGEALDLGLEGMGVQLTGMGMGRRGVGVPIQMQ